MNTTNTTLAAFDQRRFFDKALTFGVAQSIISADKLSSRPAAIAAPARPICPIRCSVISLVLQLDAAILAPTFGRFVARDGIRVAIT